MHIKFSTLSNFYSEYQQLYSLGKVTRTLSASHVKRDFDMYDVFAYDFTDHKLSLRLVN